MPPYLRFPEQDVISQKFWGVRSYNPTCGLISMERGTKIFVWANMIYGAASSILCVLIFLLHFFVGPSTSSHQELINNLKENQPNHRADVEFIEKVYLNKSATVIQSVLFFSFLFCAYWWYMSWRLKKAVVEHDIPTMKKFYIIMLVLSIIMTVLQYWDSELIWSKAFLFDIPCTILQIMGFIFVHGYIVSVMNPDTSQHDDLNRIQFSP